MEASGFSSQAAMLRVLKQGSRSLGAARTALSGWLPPPSGAQGTRAAWMSVAAAAAWPGLQRGAAGAAVWQQRQQPPPAGSGGGGSSSRHFRGPSQAFSSASAQPGEQHQQQQQQQQPPAHLRQLSEEQLAAVTAPLGTLRVVAGPGSGKVRCPSAWLPAPPACLPRLPACLPGWAPSPPLSCMPLLQPRIQHASSSRDSPPPKALHTCTPAGPHSPGPAPALLCPPCCRLVCSQRA